LLPFTFQLGDAKDDNEKNKMRTALRVVSEERQSERLQAVARAEKAVDGSFLIARVNEGYKETDHIESTDPYS
jgi:hypothetical protein